MYIILKATSYIKDAITDKQSSINQLLWYLDIIGLYHSVAIL